MFINTACLNVTVAFIKDSGVCCFVAAPGLALGKVSW